MRADGQKAVIVMMKDEFLDRIDKAMESMGYSDRSTLIRDAVFELLKQHGVEVKLEEKTAPGRKGKGGRPRKNHDTAAKTA